MEKPKEGRPTEYKEEYPEKAYKLCLLGATDKEIADFFDVSEQTINSWKHKFPEFLESIKKGKIEADSLVAEKLLNRATGYEKDYFEEQVTKDGDVVKVQRHAIYPPDTTAIIFWLKNRQPGKWRDKQEVQHGLDNSIESIDISIKKKE